MWGIVVARGFGALNKALITMTPKKLDAERVGDYRPISLGHSFSKSFAKAFSDRARRRMAKLVQVNQLAFIKTRNPHDNFLLVRQVARKLHAKKIKGVILKLDLMRAFDSFS